ncbi:MAG: DUF3754 domain-containing protein [Pseudomonadales bacterium]|nr:DUF3754 domain-containing protein [Pseudomonadales bacterium]
MSHEHVPLRFIPFRKKDLTDLCAREGLLAGSDAEAFGSFCQLLQSVYHFEFHRLLENLKDAYAPLNPNRDTRVINSEPGQVTTSFIDQLDHLLDRANYEKLTEAELQQAFSESSLFQLRVIVDFDAFEEVLLFTRGESNKTEMVSSLFGLRKKQLTFANFDRVVLYIRLKDAYREKYPRLGGTLLKLFQNVPRADIEILFPTTRVGMRLIDKLMIGVPAVVGGGVVLTTKVGASLLLLGGMIGFWLGVSQEPVELNQAAIVAIMAAFGALGSFIWKQFVNFKNRKLTFMQSLTESLYFKNLDNNAGVFYRLIDDAEEEECKEALLAFYFLTTRPEINNAAALDAAIEQWFQETLQCAVDFEIDDALEKLATLGLLKTTEPGLAVVSLAEACKILDQRWDDAFRFAG